MNSVVTERFIECHNKLISDRTVKSSRQFALDLEFLPQSLSEIIKGRRDVTIELLRKAIDKYNINPKYLFSGDDTMFLNQYGSDLRILTVVTSLIDQKERIVHVPVRAQAGYASESNNAEYISDLPTYTLPDNRFKYGSYRSFDINGDSMEPTLRTGDKVVCSFIEPGEWVQAIRDYHVYVVITKNDIVIKRVKNNLLRHKHLELISDNEFYNPYRVNISEIRELWYVTNVITTFDHSAHKHNSQMNEIKHFQNTIIEQTKMILRLNQTIEKLYDSKNVEFPEENINTDMAYSQNL